MRDFLSCFCVDFPPVVFLDLSADMVFESAPACLGLGLSQPRITDMSIWTLLMPTSSNTSIASASRNISNTGSVLILTFRSKLKKFSLSEILRMYLPLVESLILRRFMRSGLKRRNSGE